MASLTISGAAASSSSAASSSADAWITPQEQLDRLARFAAEEQLQADESGCAKKIVRARGAGGSVGADSVIKSLARSILRHSNLSGPTTPAEVPSLEDLIVEQLIKPIPLPSMLTNWYVARKRLGILPERMPPLPRNIFQIVNAPCLIYDTQTKSDETPYTVGDTHALQLLREEDGNLNQFEAVVKRYGEEHYPGDNPLRFRYFLDDARQEYGDVPFEPTHWDLLTKDVLPGSRNKPFSDQFEMIRSLSQKASVDYELPSLKNISRTVFLHKVATGESLYPAGNEQNNQLYTLSFVEELTQNWRLMFGGFAPSGARVTDIYSSCVINFVGVGARRRFFRPSAIGNSAIASDH